MQKEQKNPPSDVEIEWLVAKLEKDIESWQNILIHGDINKEDYPDIAKMRDLCRRFIEELRSGDFTHIDKLRFDYEEPADLTKD